MRPNTLLIKGFGSYAEETRIPFDELGDGLYLITGDTGAGKTTIFDAIMFALYGTVGGDHRKINMMHSDYIPKGEDSVVDLTFTHNGRRHRVRRTIHMKKKRGQDNVYEFTQDADLWEENKAALTGQNAVTKRITAILDNLDATQFQQIIMLAQGEFRKFLDSNSENRSVILGRLFDSSPYIRFQNWLQAADASLTGQRKALTEEIRMVMQHGFVMPASLTPEEEALYQADHPDLVRALENLIGEDAALEQVLAEKREDCEKTRQALLLTRGKAGEDNEKLAKLDRAAGIYQAFADKDPEMEERRARILVVRRAVRDVLPAEREVRLSEDRLQSMDQALEDLRTREKERERALALAGERAGENPKKREAIRQLSVREESIRKQIPVYREADALGQKVLLKQKEVQTKEKEVRQMGAAIEGMDREIRQTEEKLSGLDQVQTELAAAEKKLSEAREVSERLMGPEGLFARIRKTRDRAAAWEREKTRLVEKTRKAAEASEASQKLYQAFIEGQARILAGQLEKDVSERGEAPCPVCGTAIRTPWRSPSFAGLVPPERSRVEAARKAAEEAEKDRADQASYVQQLAAESRQGQEAAVREINQIYRQSRYSWEMLMEPGRLDRMEGRIAAAIEEREKELSEVSRKAEARDSLREALTALRDRLEKTRRAREDQSAAYTESQAELAGLQGRCKALRDSLDFENEKAASLEADRLVKDQEKLKAAVEEAERQEKEAGEALGRVRGQIANALKTREKETETRSLLERKYEAALTGAFATRAAYEEAISFCGRENGEGWLDKETRLVTEHEGGKAHALEVLTELEKETQGLEKKDLEAMDRQIREAGDALQKAGDALQERRNLLHNHTETLERVRSRLEEIDRITPACRRIHQLSSMAAGAADAGALGVAALDPPMPAGSSASSAMSWARPSGRFWPRPTSACRS